MALTVGEMREKRSYCVLSFVKIKDKCGGNEMDDGQKMKIEGFCLRRERAGGEVIQRRMRVCVNTMVYYINKNRNRMFRDVILINLKP